jgi:hypothetical protein
MTLLLQPASAGAAARQNSAETAAAAIMRERLTTETLLGIAFLTRAGVPQQFDLAKPVLFPWLICCT